MTASPLPLADAHLAQAGRRRTSFYVLLLTAAAIWVTFTNLGGPRLEGDEAWYAVCTDQVRRSGEWLTLRVYPPAPYFGKPPLYMWLSAATYDLIPGLEAKYRFWSALFGVGCVAGTCVLGAMLFTPEVGAIAAAVLLTNRKFHFEHGARTGTMDSALTFLLLVTLALYWTVWRRRGRPAGGKDTAAWAGIGVAAGLAWMFKPFFGLPLSAVVAVHAVTFGRGWAWRRRLGGLAFAAGVMVVVGLPWYLVQWYRFGRSFSDMVVGAQVVDRFATAVHHGITRGPAYYLTEVSTSSAAFYLCVPAVGWALVSAIRRRSRKDAETDLSDCTARGFANQLTRPANEPAVTKAGSGLLLLVVLGWVVLPSASPTKFLHYAYPAFPALAILIASFGVTVMRSLVSASRRNASEPALTRRALALAGVAAFAVLLVQICHLGFYEMPRHQKKHAAWETYQTFRPAIDRGDARLVSLGVPTTADRFGDLPDLLPTDLFYLGHMLGVTPLDSPDSLSAILADGKPTIALLARTQDLQPTWNRLGLDARSDARFASEHRAFAVAAVDLGSLLDTHSVPGGTNRWLSLSAAATRPGEPAGVFERTFSLRVTPPLPGQDMRVELTLRRLLSTRATRVRCRVSGADDLTFNGATFAFGELMRVAVDLQADTKSPAAARDVSIGLESADEAPAKDVVRAAVTDVRLIVLPKPSVE